MLRGLAIAVLVVAIGGCPAAMERPNDADAIDTTDAATIDATAHDAGRDARASADAGTDVGSDAGVDAAVPDTGMDVGLDAGCVAPAAPTTFEEFEAAYERALCAYEAACAPDADALFGGADCVTTLSARDEGSLAAYRALIDAGLVRFDASSAAACIRAISCTSCAGFVSGSLACIGYVAGTRADGAACAADVECASTYCDDPMGCGNTGTCRPRIADGAACVVGGTPCALPSRCDSSGHCAPFVFARAGDPCPTGDCAGGLLLCWAGTCHEASEGWVQGLGETCERGRPNDCARGLVCPSNPPMTCRSDDVPIGGACVPSYPDACTADARCDGTTCRALPAPGESCAPTFVCAAGAYCRCPTDVACTTGYVCVTQHRLGEACNSNNECWSGACISHACAPHPICD